MPRAYPREFRVRAIALVRAGKQQKQTAEELGIQHQHKKVILIIDHYKVSVVEKKTGEILSKHAIEPTRTYWTNVLLDEATKRSREPK